MRVEIVAMILLICALISGCEYKTQEKNPTIEDGGDYLKDFENSENRVAISQKDSNQKDSNPVLDKSSVLPDGRQEDTEEKTSTEIDTDVIGGNWPPDTDVNQPSWELESSTNTSSEVPDSSEGFGAHGTEKHRIIDYEYIEKEN